MTDISKTLKLVYQSYFYSVYQTGVTDIISLSVLQVWLAYQKRGKKDKTWLVIWLVSALLINPFVKVVLGRTIWNIIDVIWAVLLAFSTYKNREASKPK